MLTAIARMLGMQITQLSMSSAEPKKTESIDSGIGLVDTPSPKVDSDEDVFFDDDEEEIDIDAIEVDTSDLTDASVKILPGVRHMPTAFLTGSGVWPRLVLCVPSSQDLTQGLTMLADHILPRCSG
jgi:hypothetical protein